MQPEGQGHRLQKGLHTSRESYEVRKLWGWTTQDPMFPSCLPEVLKTVGRGGTLENN